MEKLFLYIKHNLKPLWKAIESCNAIFLKIIYKKQLDILGEKYSNFCFTNNEFQYRLITAADLDTLHGFLSMQEKDYIKYFSPHSFACEGLRAVLESKNYLTFGYFHNDKIVGYFMMRLFANKKIFLGYIVDSAYTGKKIGKDMVRIMCAIAQTLKWEAYATISKKNIPSLNLHSHKVVKQLPNEYILVKFIN